MNKQEKSINKVTIVAISDTHGNNFQLKKALQNNIEGDIFIHAGDFTSYNKRAHFSQLIELLSKLKFRHKIVIPGNHEILLDESIPIQDRKQFGIFHVFDDMSRQKQIQRLQQIGVTYLEHDLIQIQNLKIFASSYTVVPPYWSTAFQINQEKMEEIWQGVPHVDILITHGPPFQILDKTVSGKHVGSKRILKYIDQFEPKMHIFGHIHEAKGNKLYNKTMCYNVAQKLTSIQVNKN